jgi:DNA replication protein DnaC
MAADTR